MTPPEIEARIEQILALPYAFVLMHDRELGFTGEILEFPGCYAQGNTVESAHENLKGVAKMWLTWMLSDDRPIPLPLSEDGDRRVVLRLSRETYLKATRLADQNHVALDDFITRALEAKLATEPSREPSRVIVRDYGEFILIGPEQEATSRPV